jgi:TPR repeat protein
MRPLAVLLVVASPALADRHAVVVGVNRHAHPSLPPLDFAVNDAAELSVVLKRAGYAVTLLTDDTPQKPTRANIDAALRRVCQAAGAGDTVVVGLAGHGVQKGSRAFFCPADGDPGRPDGLVPVAGVYARLAASKAAGKVLLVDACRGDPGGGVTRASALPPPGVAALFSCSPGQQAVEHPQIKHGVFFHYVIRGLTGEGADPAGKVTFTSLAGFVAARVGPAVADLDPGRRQSPNTAAQFDGPPPELGKAADEPLPVGSPAARGRKLYERALDHGFGRRGYRHDPEKAVRLAQEAAELDNADAMLYLSNAVLEGWAGLARNPAKSRAWLERAAKLPGPGGLTARAELLRTGAGGTTDKPQAAALFRRAAEAGNVSAMAYLGVMLEFGNGVPADPAGAVRWYTRAADNGYPCSMGGVARLYAAGAGGLPRDFGQAVRWFQRAAENGCESAMFDLAAAHRKGTLGLTADAKAANRWLRAAAVHGSTNAMYDLAVALYAGGDTKAALAWLKKAADAGHQQALKELNRQ